MQKDLVFFKKEGEEEDVDNTFYELQKKHRMEECKVSRV